MNETVSDATTLGQAVRAERRRQGLNQRTLAELSNVSVHFLSNLENGKATSELRGCLSVLDTLGIQLVVRTRNGVPH
jgi:y4mF family transcriptional regulator